MKKRKWTVMPPYAADMIFYPALEPLEASVLPARAVRRYGALKMIPRAWETGKREARQRAKIWVR